MIYTGKLLSTYQKNASMPEITLTTYQHRCLRSAMEQYRYLMLAHEPMPAHRWSSHHDASAESLANSYPLESFDENRVLVHQTARRSQADRHLPRHAAAHAGRLPRLQERSPPAPGSTASGSRSTTTFTGPKFSARSIPAPSPTI